MTRSAPTLPAPAQVASEYTLISVYTRNQMLEDGSLIDVTSAGEPAGLRLPVALSRLAYRTTVQMSLQGPLPPRSRQEHLRLHALLLAFAQRVQTAGEPELSGPTLAFCARDLQDQPVDVYGVIEQQRGRPVLTVLLRGED